MQFIGHIVEGLFGLKKTAKFIKIYCRDHLQILPQVLSESKVIN